MIVRIVKMNFRAESVEDFLINFHANKDAIRDFEGCHLLELYRDSDDLAVFFTYSYWENDSHLQAYRQSDLFKNVWSKTKALFKDKPQVWSVDKIVSLP